MVRGTLNHLPRFTEQGKLATVRVQYKTEIGDAGEVDVGQTRPTDIVMLQEDYAPLRAGDRARLMAVDTGKAQALVQPLLQPGTAVSVPLHTIALMLHTGDPRVSSTRSMSASITYEALPGVHVVVAEMSAQRSCRPIAMALLDEAVATPVETAGLLAWANNRRAPQQRRAALDSHELATTAHWLEEQATNADDARLKTMLTAMASVLRAHK